MGLKHIGANSVTSVTAYVILYSYIQVHKLVQIESVVLNFFMKTIFSFDCHTRMFAFPIFREVCSFYATMFRRILVKKVEQILILSAFVSRMLSVSLRLNASIESP